MKKRIIIIGSIVLVCVLLGVGLFLFKDTLFKKAAPVPQTTEEPKKETTLWEDPAGFSFQYPKSITINKHDEDMENYAHLELTDTAHPGGTLFIWAKDTTNEDIDEWVKTEKSLKDASIIDTTLGGKPAKKIMLTSPSKKLITGTIDDGILFTIEEEETTQDTFWQETYTTITQSFTFTALPGEEENTGSTSEDTGESVVDEEEVLE